MRRILIAALLGAPLLIAGPASAAVGNTHLLDDAAPALSGGTTAAVLALDPIEEPAAEPAPLQFAHDTRSNPLWWLQVGVGNQWRGDRDHGPNRRWWGKDRHHHDKHWKKKHRHKHYSKHWDRDRHHKWDRDRRRHRDWDDDRRRHRDRDWDRDRDRDYRWGNDHHRR